MLFILVNATITKEQQRLREEIQKGEDTTEGTAKTCERKRLEKKMSALRMAMTRGKKLWFC